MQRTSDRTLILKDGRTLRYPEYGNPLGKPILLFHGTPGSRLEGALFDRPAQAHNARILVADRPGYANSSPVRRGTLMGYVDDVVALADALHIDTFAVLGASGGGLFALACAAKFPELVRYCGLMSAIGPLALPHSMDGMASGNRIFFALLTADQLEVVRAGGKGITFDFGILTRDLVFPFKQIHTKVPMWHGAEDTLAPLALASYVAEHNPGCVIKDIPNAGHAGTYACADEVMRTLVQ